MAPRPRRLRNLNLDQVADREAVENGQDNLPHDDTEESLQGSDTAEREDQEAAEDGNEESLQGPPNVDRLLAHIPRKHPRSPIKIIWPNGNKREVLGDFTSNLLALEGGKVIVGTDENGVPNERPASVLAQHLGQVAEKPSLAPLDIQRWDNELFKPHKERIIKDVEEKFAFPPPMRHLTRDWILKTVNNKWWAYKSKLKKQHFNRDERSLEEIIKGKPQTVNEYQWKSLVGFWCSEPHKKLSATNSQCAKQQKNTHTTGRKSHARLKREMEQTEKRKILRLELWEAAHTKKDGTYSSDKVDSVMDASCAELQRRQQINNGNLSAKDFNEVFDDIVAKELKIRGFYDNKFWSEVRASQGVTFVTPSEDERRYRDKVNAMDNKMQHMTGLMKHWLDFMTKKFPEEKFIINEIEAALDDGDELQSKQDSSMKIDPDNRHDHLKGNKVDSPTNYEQEVHIQSSTHVDKRDSTTDFEDDPIMTNMRTRRVKARTHDESSKVEVYLISLRHKGRVVAKGHLVTSDSRRVIGETRLGNEFVAVRVDGLENVATGNKGDEEIPRPLYSINTLLGAVGYVIAWPRSYEVTSSSHT